MKRDIDKRVYDLYTKLYEPINNLKSTIKFIMYNLFLEIFVTIIGVSYAIHGKQCDNDAP